MSISIAKGQCKFRYGFQKVDQLVNFLQSNPDAIGIAMVGRSNVGKSSLINSIFGRGLAKTSKTPGRTRQVNVFEFYLLDEGKPTELPRKLFLYDLPGYGHAEVSKEMARQWQNLMNTFFTEINPHTLLVCLQDARHPNQKSDQQFYDYLRNFALNTTLAFNKIDKLKKQKERAALEKLKPAIYKEFKWVREIFFLSAESNKGVDAFTQSLINFIHRQFLLDEVDETEL